MSIVKKSGDCFVINTDTYGYDFICELREKHKKNGNYKFVAFEDIISNLSNRLQILLRQDEDSQLSKLLESNIISTNQDYTQFAIHPTHQQPF